MTDSVFISEKKASQEAFFFVSDGGEVSRPGATCLFLSPTGYFSQQLEK